MEFEDLGQEDANSCNAKASLYQNDKHSILSKSSDYQMSNKADFVPLSTSSKNPPETLKTKDLKISKICAPKPKKKLKEWHKNHCIGKSQEQTKHRISDRDKGVKNGSKVKQTGQRVQMT